MYNQARNQLIHRLQNMRYLTSKIVIQAFQNVPRELFVPSYMQQHAYADTPLEIGLGQTISAPHMVAIMCEALDIHPGQKILEIGAGSGYHAAIVAHIIQPDGHIYSIERLPTLAQQAKENLAQAKITNVTVEVGDGSEGLPKYAPYDRIYITCAAPSLPQPLKNQLKPTGKILIPEGNRYCTLRLYEKYNKKFSSKNLGGCVFVPLIGKYGHKH